MAGNGLDKERSQELLQRVADTMWAAVRQQPRQVEEVAEGPSNWPQQQVPPQPPLGHANTDGGQQSSPRPSPSVPAAARGQYLMPQDVSAGIKHVQDMVSKTQQTLTKQCLSTDVRARLQEFSALYLR